jgi:CheY-like chemotaxis protein
MSPAERRVLVIDDDITVRRMLGELLANLGFSPDLAPDGLEGLARFVGGQYDAVVTDVRMPGVSGWQVASTVRRLRPEVGVVVISGSITGLLPPEEEVLRSGNLVVLAKPFGLPELQAALRQVLASSS